MPRSPSRDLSDRFRNNRAYFHRPEALRRGRYGLAAVALAGVIGWAAADVVDTPRATLARSHGPVAAVHARWDDDCAACHRVYSVAEVGPESLLRVRDRWHDLTCERCHTGAAHHAAAKPAGGPFQSDCAFCHHDHGGRDQSLTRIADEHCTACHSHLGNNHAAGTSVYADSVTNFVTDHPEFAPLRNPSAGGSPVDRTLKFSHALHLTPGLKRFPDAGGDLTVDRIAKLSDPVRAERYRKPGQQSNQAVVLDCNSCHQLDSGIGGLEFDRLSAVLKLAGEPGRSVLPPRAAGAYFLPIDFEAHCRACHPLKAGTQALGDRDQARAVMEGFDIVHRKQPADLREVLAAGYIREMVKQKHAFLEKAVEPGGLVRTHEPAGAESIRVAANRFAERAQGQLLGDCRKCHDLRGEAVAAVPDRTIRFAHARFDHSAHRGITCASCHPNTGAGFAPGGQVIEKEPVQIEGIKSCRVCHAPTGTPLETTGGGPAGGWPSTVGGVRHGCVDCHRYHNGDHALQGRGAEALNPAQPLTIPEFLSGK